MTCFSFSFLVFLLSWEAHAYQEKAGVSLQDHSKEQKGKGPNNVLEQEPARNSLRWGAQHLDEVDERSAPEAFTLQLAVSNLALAARLGHAGALEKLASITSRRDVVSACCLGCGAMRALRLCAGCRVAKFCDGVCTRRIWPLHRPVCKQWQADARAAAEE
jgi:hypothetical protein